jgi:hypothetical protein
MEPAKFGQVDNLITLASNFGERTEVYNGFDLGLNLRFAGSGMLQGGMATGQTVNNNCQVVDSPQLRFCEVTLPFEGQTQYKASVIYPLPWWGFQASGTLQNLPGVPSGAVYPASSAEIAPSLGRPLAAGGTAQVTVVEPNTIYEDRLTQIDLRLTKIFGLGHGRLKADFDIYNLFNARTILGVNTSYGPLWQRPTAVLGGRMVKVGAQVDF